MKHTDGTKIKGQVIIEEINPVTKEVISREVGDNVVCAAGADALAYAFTTASATPVVFNYMVTSTDTTAPARTSTAIAPQSAVSPLITPTVVIVPGVTSIVTWVHTFAAQAGATATWKFGMQSTALGGNLWNEYKFTAVKDNWTNDLKITYNASIAP